MNLMTDNIKGGYDLQNTNKIMNVLFEIEIFKSYKTVRAKLI